MAPASPASIPPTVRDRITRRLGCMPAYRAASGLAPTVRISKPVVLR